MARIEKLNGVIGKWINHHKVNNKIANLKTGVAYLKQKGVKLSEYALKRRCQFANVKTK